MKDPHTVAEYIRYLQQFNPAHEVVTTSTGMMVLDDGGYNARPVLRWPDHPDDIKIGDRVRKLRYPDTGAVVEHGARHGLDPRLPMSTALRAINWDNTGCSIEYVTDLGIAVEP